LWGAGVLKSEKLGTSLRIYVIGSAVVKALGLIRSVGFARLLGPEQFGIFVLCYGVVVILEPIATLGLSASLLRFSSSPRESKRMLASGLVASLGFTALFLLLSPYIGQLLKLDDRVLLVLSIASLVPYGFYHLLYSSYQGLRNFLAAVAVQLAYMGMFTIGGMVALWLISPKAITGISLHATGCALAALLVVPLLLSGGRAKSSLALRTVVLYGVFTIAIDLGFEAYRYVDRYVINWYLDSASVGTFSAAYTLATIPMMLGSVLGEVLLPHLSTIFDEGGRKKAAEYLNMFAKVVLIAGMFIVGTAALIKGPIIELLYGTEYADAAKVFPVLTAYHVIFAAYNIIFLYFFLLKKPQIGMLTTACGLVTSFVLNVLLVPRLGITGAAWATFGSGCAILLLLIVLTALFKLALDKRLLVCLACLLLIPLNFGVYIFVPLGLLLWFAPIGMRAAERREIVRIVRGGGLERGR